MHLSTLFTDNEKRNYLIKSGYNLVDYTEKYWEQWGNHDSQGSWENRNHVCAIKNDEIADIKNTYDKVFEVIVKEKFKEFLLS